MTSELRRNFPGLPNIPAAALDHEIAQEMASALGRMGRALEQALGKLEAFDRLHSGDAQMEPGARESRRALVSAAGMALWQFVVQREACGLRDSRQIMRDYRVPAEVQGHSGIVEPVVPGRRPRR